MSSSSELSSSDKTFGCLLVFIVAPLIAVGTTILEGWMVSIMWSWFVVKQFGLPALSVPVSIGIICLASMLTQTPQIPVKDEYTKGLKAYFGVVWIRWAILMLTAYIVHLMI